MARKKVNVADVQKRELDKREQEAKALSEQQGAGSSVFRDSFQNFVAKMGIGTDNLTSYSTYGFNPISRNRTLLEWIYRGSWIAGVMVDAIAEDMTREGVSISSEMDPEDQEKLQQAETRLQLWPCISDAIKWARLYGGAIIVPLIDGQRMDTPLKIERIAKGQLKGFLVYDRWMCEPALEDLVIELGPSIGLPKFYNVTADAPALPRAKIHYSRAFRFEGIHLPYWQRLTENLWGLSVIERLYDRMIAFDSATQGASQLVYKSYIRTYKVKGLREVTAAGGELLDGMARYVQFMGKFQSNEGITLLDADDELDAGPTASFSGLSEALVQFGQQLSGATGIPLVRLFGQSPAGLNSSGESDLRTYYDGIKRRQKQELMVPINTIYHLMAQSEGITLEDSFTFDFNPLWIVQELEKAQISEIVTRTVLAAEEAGLVTQQTALKELRSSSRVTGVWDNITADDIEKADDELPDPSELMLGAEGELGEQPAGETGKAGEGAGNNEEESLEAGRGTGDDNVRRLARP